MSSSWAIMPPSATCCPESRAGPTIHTLATRFYHKKSKALHPIAGRHRLTIKDNLDDKTAYQAEVDDPNRVQDVLAIYGDFTNERMVFENCSVIPLEKIVICPPFMHDSHRLLEQVAHICGSFKKHPTTRGSREEIIQNKLLNLKLGRMSSMRSIDRTVGCNEQSSARVRMAATTQEDFVALPECIQDIIRLIGYLQAMYYSSEPVTDAAVAFHFMAAAVAHLIHVTIAFIPNKDKTSISLLSSSEAKTKEKPCAENLYSISRLTTQPLCHKHLKVPLFYILEEYFEREFIKNQEVAAKLHRKAVLEGICLIEQTTLACSFLTGMRSFGRQDYSVPQLQRLKCVRVHDCCKDAKHWFGVRTLTTVTFEPTREMIQTFQETVDEVWEFVEEHTTLTWGEEGTMSCSLADHGIELVCCLCGECSRQN
ncbi:hypothetical protein J8273_7210 [Carpediemonas membranifera]|uniref:Uncharacterized protein n=1 Tax=Carpediemonas membranifera TaxID=201153 RepID=A0A8J6DZM4_9EUKA|nr:hypothetical protein J8273_7210 [Carpediemonas membranifera]|eukprot:KAG9390938.1 hypothetical protein J8273_7210 [Carpediemonas membranifera]